MDKMRNRGIYIVSSRLFKCSLYYTVAPVLFFVILTGWYLEKLCYCKDDRVMRSTYECPKNFRDP